MAGRKRRAEDIEGGGSAAGGSTTSTSAPSDSKSDSFQRQCLSVIFRDKRLRVSEDRMSVVSSNAESGYSSILATSSASSGRWYFEIIVEEMPEGSHIRVGWSTRRTRYDTPIGSDCFSYAIRDMDCARVTLGKRWDARNDSSICIKQGDVVGCLLELPLTVNSPRTTEDPMTFFPNLLCDPENVTEPEFFDEANSSITFFVNGNIVGEQPAFTNLVKGEYYPAVSLYGKVKVRFDFEAQRAKDLDAKCAAEMYVPPSMIKPKKRPTNFIPRGLMASGA